VTRFPQHREGIDMFNDTPDCVLQVQEDRSSPFSAGPSNQPTALIDLLTALCDELAFGAAVVDRSCRLIFSNLMARRLLTGGHHLFMNGDRLLTSSASDSQSLARIVERACAGRRQWHEFSTAASSLHVAFVPLAAGNEGAAALVFERLSLSSGTSAHFFARSRGLTATEERLMQALCESVDVEEAASALGMRVNTARTHVRSILQKTGERSLRSLLRKIGMLPPVSSRLEVLSESLWNMLRPGRPAPARAHAGIASGFPHNL